MKTRHVYRFFDRANHLVFGGALPRTKINLSNKDGDAYGVCKAHAFKGRKLISHSITLYPRVIEATNPFGALERSLKHILLHEMVHLMQYVTAGRLVYDVIKNPFDWHDKETFQDYANIAFDAGLIDAPELLLYDYDHCKTDKQWSEYYSQFN